MNNQPPEKPGLLTMLDAVERARKALEEAHAAHLQAYHKAVELDVSNSLKWADAADGLDPWQATAKQNDERALREALEVYEWETSTKVSGAERELAECIHLVNKEAKRVYKRGYDD
jgi:hypothetical protein